MANITAIKSIRNRSDANWLVINIENPNDTDHGEGINVLTGMSLAFNMWIPWANDATQFEGHRIDFQMNGSDQQIISIWQQDDHIWFTRTLAGQAGVGPFLGQTDLNMVDGNNSIIGDRSVEIVGEGPAVSEYRLVLF
jgi:hypothetical protein